MSKIPVQLSSREYNNLLAVQRVVHPYLRKLVAQSPLAGSYSPPIRRGDICTAYPEGKQESEGIQAVAVAVTTATTAQATVEHPEIPHEDLRLLEEFGVWDEGRAPLWLVTLELI